MTGVLRWSEDCVGQRYTRLVVIQHLGVINHASTVRCRCDCGNEKVFRAATLPHTKSCGCLKRERSLRGSLPTHGHAKHSHVSRTYRSWQGMRQRCNDPKGNQWHNYGGRGIRVCERWSSFQNFLDDMGHRPEGHRISLDRINNDGNYEPGNCRWATPTEQARNSRSNVFSSELAKEARRLRSQGLTYKQVSQVLGRKLGTVVGVLNGNHWAGV